MTIASPLNICEAEYIHSAWVKPFAGHVQIS